MYDEAIVNALAGPLSEEERASWAPQEAPGVVWGPKPSLRDALIHAAFGLEGPSPRNDAEARDRQVASVLRALAEAFPREL